MFWSLIYNYLRKHGFAAESELARCSEPENPDQSILFIGNSFTYYGAMPCTFYKLAKERLPSRELRVFFQGGAGLMLWQHGGSKNTQTTLLNSGKWDIVVLQEQSEMALSPRSLKRMREGCRWFAKAIRRLGGKPALLMTWCDLDRPEDQVAISKAYRSLAQELDAILIPAGELFLEVTKKDASVVLYDEDKHHPSNHGSYLVACLTEAILLLSKDELRELVKKYREPSVTLSQVENCANRDQGDQCGSFDPVEEKLAQYAAEFALRFKSEQGDHGNFPTDNPGA
ncbi:MAG: hypothetical protein JST44_04550 [Cyanobacteria bacterium SZAS LIN-5]|nr:hypothetical protein [Cyanobacteria bacterium SZAS LIN-5]